MWATLAVGKQEILPTIENPIRDRSSASTDFLIGNPVRESRKKCGDLENPGQAGKKRGGAARLEYEFVREDEHAGFR